MTDSDPRGAAMATMTMPKTLNDEPEIVAIDRQDRDARGRQDALATEGRAIDAAINPYVFRDGPTTVSAADRLRMMDREPEVRRALRIVAIERDEIARTRETTLAAVRARRAAPRAQQRRELLRQLIQREAAPVLRAFRELAALDAADIEDGIPTEPLAAWYEPRWQMFLDACRSLGMVG